MNPDPGFFLIGRYRCTECAAMTVGDPVVDPTHPEPATVHHCFCGGRIVHTTNAQMPLGSNSLVSSKELTRGHRATMAGMMS